MKQYRVVKYIGEKERVEPQRRFLMFFWTTLRPKLCCTSYIQAEDICIYDARTIRRRKQQRDYVNAHVN